MKKIELEIYEAPPSINTFYGHTGNRRYITARGRRFKDYIENHLQTLKSEGKIVSLGDARLKVEVLLYFKGKRLRDLDNYLKTLIDCFKGILFIDDEQIDWIEAKRFYHAPCNKVCVTIRVLKAR
jgi:crossover junction endodeoxyribonuclease RusA